MIGDAQAYQHLSTVEQTQDLQWKQELQAQYQELNQQVKKNTRADKRSFIHDLTEEAETAAGKRDMKRLYDITRTLSEMNKAPPKTSERQKRQDHHR